MRYIHLPPALLLLLPLLPCGPTHADDEPASKTHETWARLHVDGAHSGYAHTRVRTVEEDGVERIETHATTDMKMVRMGTTTHIHSVSETWETPAGRLLRIATVTKMSAQEMRTTFTFTDGKLTVETSVMGTPARRNPKSTRICSDRRTWSAR